MMRYRIIIRNLAIYGAFALILIFCVGKVDANQAYDLVLELKTVNFTGRPVRAMTINGRIPGPT